MIFLGVEMASVPSYVLAGMLKGRRRAAKRRSSMPSTAPAPRASCSTASACWPADWARPICRRWLSKLAPWIFPATNRRRRQSRHAHGAGARRPDDRGRSGVQAIGRAVSLLVPGRVRRGSAEVDAFLSVASKAAAMALLVRVAHRRRAPSWCGSHGDNSSGSDARLIRFQSHAVADVSSRPKRRTPTAAASAEPAPLEPGAASFIVADCWRSWRPSPARSATWPPTVRRTSSGCWPIRRSRTPAT